MLTPGAAPAARGSQGHLIAGHLPDLGRDILGFLLRRARDYGDLAPLRFAPGRAFPVSNPAAFAEVLVAQRRCA